MRKVTHKAKHMITGDYFDVFRIDHDSNGEITNLFILNRAGKIVRVEPERYKITLVSEQIQIETQINE